MIIMTNSFNKHVSVTKDMQLSKALFLTDLCSSSVIPNGLSETYNINV